MICLAFGPDFLGPLAKHFAGRHGPSNNQPEKRTSSCREPNRKGSFGSPIKKGRRRRRSSTANKRGFAKSTVTQNARKKGCVSKASKVKLTWLVSAGDPVARSHKGSPMESSLAAFSRGGRPAGETVHARKKGMRCSNPEFLECDFPNF